MTHLFVDADRKADMTSVERQLQDKVVLLVKQKVGEEEHWSLPHIPHQDGESMRQVLVQKASQSSQNGPP